MEKRLDEFLRDLQGRIGKRKRANLDELQQSFQKIYPEKCIGDDLRLELYQALQRLVKNDKIRFPSQKTRGAWDMQRRPELPKWVQLEQSGIGVAVAKSFDHRSYGWVPQLQFLANVRRIPSPDHALALQQFFANGGSNRPWVPAKERAWELFGNEYALDQPSQVFFGDGKLTLDDLRCRPVVHALANTLNRKARGRPILVIENECTYHSLCRLNVGKALYSAVVFGNGREVVKGAQFLGVLSERLGAVPINYFGDIDREGLRIAEDLSKRLLEQTTAHLCLDGELYRHLLDQQSVDPGSQYTGDEIEWENTLQRLVALNLDQFIAEKLAIRLHHELRLAQEALGWQALCMLYGSDPFVDFDSVIVDEEITQ